MSSLGKLLRFGSVVVATFVLAESSLAVPYVGKLNTGLGSLSWPNPHHYTNFIASGEFCTSTHFVCERPDFEIQTASIGDVPEFGDLPLADPVKRTASKNYSRRSSGGQNGGSGGVGGGGVNATSNAGDSPTGPFNGGGIGDATTQTNPTINPPTDPTVNPPPNLPPTPSPIPLPGSVWLLLAATLGLGLYRRQFIRFGA